MLDKALEAVGEAVEGIEAVLLIGMDGMTVASWLGGEEGLEPDLMAASYADLLRKVGTVHRETGLGEPREVIVSSDERIALFRSVTSSYGLVLILESGGSLGRARFEARKAAGRLRPEMGG